MPLLHGSLKSHAFLYFCQQNTTADPSKIGMLLYSIIQACRHGAKASDPCSIDATELWVLPQRHRLLLASKTMYYNN